MVRFRPAQRIPHPRQQGPAHPAQWARPVHEAAQYPAQRPAHRQHPRSHRRLPARRHRRHREGARGRGTLRGRGRRYRLRRRNAGRTLPSARRPP